jgi:hypothetical protein
MAQADRSIRAAFWIVALTAFAQVGWTFFSQNESWLAPVVRDVRVTSIERDAEAITLAGELHLVRHCTFLDLSIHVGDARAPGEERERLLFRTVSGRSDLGPPVADGTVAWGPWRIERPHSLAGPHLFMRLGYRCNGMAPATGVFVIGDADRLFGR